MQLKRGSGLSSLLIRSATQEDSAALLAIYAPFVRDTVVSFEVDEPTVEEFASRVRDITLKYPWFVATIGEQIAGYAYACEHRSRAAYRWSVDVSVYVASGHRGQGIGRALYQRLFDELRVRGYFNAYAGITLPNEASVHLHESMGFTPVGIYRGVGHKFGVWHDVGWWQFALRSREQSPGSLR